MRRCAQVVADPDSRYTLVNLIGALHCLQTHVRMTQLELDSISQRVDGTLAILEDAATEGK